MSGLMKMWGVIFSQEHVPGRTKLNGGEGHGESQGTGPIEIGWRVKQSFEGFNKEFGLWWVVICGAFSAHKCFETGEWYVPSCILERSVRIHSGNWIGQAQSGRGRSCCCHSLGKRWWWSRLGKGEKGKDWREIPKVEKGCGSWVRGQSKVSQEFCLGKLEWLLF